MAGLTGEQEDLRERHRLSLGRLDGERRDYAGQVIEVASAYADADPREEIYRERLQSHEWEHRTLGSRFRTVHESWQCGGWAVDPLCRHLEGGLFDTKRALVSHVRDEARFLAGDVRNNAHSAPPMFDIADLLVLQAAVNIERRLEWLDSHEQRIWRRMLVASPVIFALGVGLGFSERFSGLDVVLVLAAFVLAAFGLTQVRRLRRSLAARARTLRSYESALAAVEAVG
jgi:hypothetical protein